MSCRRLVFSFAIGVLGCAASAAQGALLFTRSVTIDRSANIFKTEQFNLKLDFTNTYTSPVTNTLFGNLVISPTSVGQTFAATPATDSHFNAAAIQLSDALNQVMRFVMTESASGRSEGRGSTQALFFGKPTAAPDFAGKVIDKVELKINQFTLVFPLPGGAQAVTTGKPVELNFSVNVFGHSVPEPSTLGLVGGALALAAARKRRACSRGR
jgi:PEP-CTERM motif